MNEKTINLGKLHADIWWAHDEKEFDRLSHSASRLFQELGFPKKNSNKAGKYVSKAYYYYDKAGKYDKLGDKTKREYYFKKVLEFQIKVREVLNEKTITAYFENFWWREFHYRKYLKVFPFMLLQQIFKYQKFNLMIPLKCTMNIVRAGVRGHDERNKEMAIKYLSKYWDLLLKHNMKYKIQY
jgi:hypothetical protein